MALDISGPRANAPAPLDDGGTDRRRRFLQVVADAARETLADNIDYLFEPFGRELPDPAATGERLAAQLEILDRCSTLWSALGDEPSRDLLLRLLAYRALGPAHVRLQLDPREYRRTVIGMSAQALRQACVTHLPGMPLEWQHHEYDFRPFGLEGADLGVLAGAAHTIATQRPRLAIACYHKPDDLVAIPDLIADLGVTYRWYLQCSTMTDVDTVAFGVPA